MAKMPKLEDKSEGAPPSRATASMSNSFNAICENMQTAMRLPRPPTAANEKWPDATRPSLSFTDSCARPVPMLSVKTKGADNARPSAEKMANTGKRSRLRPLFAKAWWTLTRRPPPGTTRSNGTCKTCLAPKSRRECSPPEGCTASTTRALPRGLMGGARLDTRQRLARYDAKAPN